MVEEQRPRVGLPDDVVIRLNAMEIATRLIFRALEKSDREIAANVVRDLLQEFPKMTEGKAGEELRRLKSLESETYRVLGINHGKPAGT